MSERMNWEETESLVEFTGKIRCESRKSIAWHHWSNSQLDSQQSCRCSWLGITKSMGFGHRYQRLASHVYG